MTRAASLLLRVVGLALVLVAAMGFVLVGDGGAWTAHGSVAAGRTALLVEPALASVLGPSVSVRVSPIEDDDAGYFLGRGRSDDLAAYVQDRDVVRVVGFDGSRRLALLDGPPAVPATPDPTAGSTPAASGQRLVPTTVDLWQQQVTGPRARELSWHPTPGARSILIAHEDGSALPALDVTVTWTEGRWLWYPVAALVLGLAMIVGGFALVGALPLDALRSRAAQVRAAVASRGPTPARRPTTASTTATTAATTAATGEATGAATGADDDRALAQDAGAAAQPGSASPGGRPAAPPADGGGHEQPTPVGEAPLTRRAARGRRRKESAWQRARAKAMSRAGGRR